MLAMKAQALELSMVFSQSLARRRHRPSQASVRSTTHRRGNTSKPLAVSDRLMIAMVQSPCPLRASRNLPPASVLCLDVETTGFHSDDRIVSFAGILLRTD